MRTKLSLVVTIAAGDDPILATGLLFVHLTSICRRSDPAAPQIWRLSAAERRPDDPLDLVSKAADHRHMTAGAFLAEGQLPQGTLASSPLG